MLDRSVLVEVRIVLCHVMCEMTFLLTTGHVFNVSHTLSTYEENASSRGEKLVLLQRKFVFSTSSDLTVILAIIHSIKRSFFQVPFWQLVRSGEQRARHKPRSQARADWMVRWPMRKMEHPVHLVDWLRAVPAGTIDLLSANAENVRCWYLYPPSRADQTFNTEQLEDLCPSSESLSSSDDVVEPMQEGGWRQRNALRAVHALLYTKKWSVAKMGLRTFYGPDIRSQNPTKWFLLDKESAVSEEDA